MSLWQAYNHCLLLIDRCAHLHSACTPNRQCIIAHSSSKLLSPHHQSWEHSELSKNRPAAKGESGESGCRRKGKMSWELCVGLGIYIDDGPFQVSLHLCKDLGEETLIEEQRSHGGVWRVTSYNDSSVFYSFEVTFDTRGTWNPWGSVGNLAQLYSQPSSESEWTREIWRVLEDLKLQKGVFSWDGPRGEDRPPQL